MISRGKRRKKMFCKNCGKEIDDSAVVCPNCGVATENMAKNTTPVPAQKNTIAVVGFVLSFFTSLIGLIVSIVGLVNAKKPEYNGDGKSFAIAGIIISSIETVLIIIIYAAVIGTACAVAGAYAAI